MKKGKDRYRKKIKKYSVIAKIWKNWSEHKFSMKIHENL